MNSIRITKKYRARKKLLGLLKRPDVDGLAKMLGHETPGHAQRSWLEAKIQESWAMVLPEIEGLVDKVVEDSKDDEQSAIQSG